MLKYIIGFVILMFLSCRQETPTEFTFIKLGHPIQLGKPYGENVGVSVYVKLMPNGDSLIVNLITQFDNPFERNLEIETFVIPVTNELQVVMDNFILHSKDNDTFHFPGNEFTLPAIYDGGRFAVTYKLIDETKYFTFVLKKTPSFVQNLVDRFIAFKSVNKPSYDFKSNIKVNTDSIAIALCRKMDIILNPPLINPPPIKDFIKFVPPK